METTTIDRALVAECADCNSEARIVHLDDNVHMLQILHDDTCPTLAKIEARKEQA